MKPIPIKRKGCKNVGWIWNETKTEKLVVPLKPGKLTMWESDLIVFPPRTGTYILAEDYSKMLSSKPRHWWQFWK